ncbi:MAG: hypothetical protein IPK77_01320 [Cellvibrio sp.]|nr:hypothetical protein [Cellvibrio sp.]
MGNKENEVASFAGKVHRILVKKHGLNSACYLLTFFIYKYCKEVIGIETKIVIGWVNDGTWNGVSSHAWIEYNGKKIDVSLSVTADETISPSGDAVVLDEIIESGSVSYSYFYDVPESAKNTYAQLKKSANQQILNFINSKEKEHKMMKEISRSDTLIDQFFDNAPSSRRYNALKSLVETEC